MIKIRNVKERIEVNLFDERSIYLGTLRTELQFLDVRLQIKEQKLEGYYFMWKNIKIPIESNGVILDWPDGFFDLRTKMIQEIHDI